MNKPQNTSEFNTNNVTEPSSTEPSSTEPSSTEPSSTEPSSTDVSNQVESFSFQSDINQLLSLIINSFYSNKDVFLRELLSNASDALDKVKYNSLTNQALLQAESKFEIKVIPNKENNTLTISDTGVGMTKQHLVENLGTIARSGTKEFMQALQSGQTGRAFDVAGPADNTTGTDVSMIGQFGVGFYSAYLVADRVVMRTKNCDDEEYLWESNAGGTFTITKCEQLRLTRGSELTLYLKPDCVEYLEEQKIKDLVKTHSEFIDYPIYLYVEKEVEREVVAPDETVKSGESDETAEVDETTKIDEPDEPGKAGEADEPQVEKEKVTEPAEKQTEKVTVQEFEHLNKTKPLWTRNAKDITHDEYAAFYKGISNDWEDHSVVKHFKVEGAISFKALLYCPQRAPFDMFQQQPKKLNNIKLYVNRVFITDDCSELLPEYLSFIRGVVDSEDLPLNVSREFFQQNNQVMRVMKKHILKKCLDMFAELALDKEKYNKFYEAFSKNIKLGVYDDDKNRDKLAKLLRFRTSKSSDLVSLDEYVVDMPEDQKDIYYLSGESLDAVRYSPFLERCNKKGYGVLFLTDTIDEYSFQQLREYDGKQLVCLSKENVKFDTDESAEDAKTKQNTYGELCKNMKEVLGDRVEKVVVSNKLTDTPCCLTANQYGMSPNQERIMKAQAMATSSPMMNTGSKKIMEINADNDIVQSLKTRFETSKGTDQALQDIVMLMYENSCIDSGYSLENPQNFTRRIYRMTRLGLGVGDEFEDDVEDVEELITDGAQELNKVELDMEGVD
jgi:molecular chaperone HtpG